MIVLAARTARIAVAAEIEAHRRWRRQALSCPLYGLSAGLLPLPSFPSLRPLGESHPRPLPTLSLPHSHASPASRLSHSNFLPFGPSGPDDGGGKERNESGGHLDMHVYWSWRRGKQDGAGFPGRHSMGNDLPASTLNHTGQPSTASNPDAGGSTRTMRLCLACIARAALLMCQCRAAPVKCQRSPTFSSAISSCH
jgi:hypothetical protein